MPFTPFHMGVALAVKPAARGHFSVLAFGVAQVAMDIEPLVGMLRDSDVLHGWSHTVAGALVIGVLVALLAEPLLAWMASFFHRKLAENRLGWILDAEPPRRQAVWWGALVGTFSHVLLDALIHRDMAPFAPLAQANPLLGWVQHDMVYLACAVLGVVGAVAWLVLRFLGPRLRGGDG